MFSLFAILVLNFTILSLIFLFVFPSKNVDPIVFNYNLFAVEAMNEYATIPVPYSLIPYNPNSLTSLDFHTTLNFCTPFYYNEGQIPFYPEKNEAFIEHPVYIQNNGYSYSISPFILPTAINNSEYGNNEDSQSWQIPNISYYVSTPMGLANNDNDSTKIYPLCKGSNLDEQTTIKMNTIYRAFDLVTKRYYEHVQYIYGQPSFQFNYDLEQVGATVSEFIFTKTQTIEKILYQFKILLTASRNIRSPLKILFTGMHNVYINNDFNITELSLLDRNDNMITNTFTDNIFCTNNDLELSKRYYLHLTYQKTLT